TPLIRLALFRSRERFSVMDDECMPSDRRMQNVKKCTLKEWNKRYMRALQHVSFLYYNAIEERRQFMEKSLSNLTSKFQYFGGAMMIPIICLVVCGFCMGISAPLVNFILPQGS